MLSEMEFGKESMCAIKLLSDSSKISDKLLTQLLEDATSAIVNRTKLNEDVYKENGYIKEAFFGVICFLLEAAKHNMDDVTLSSVLEECKVTPERTSQLVSHYKKEKKHLQVCLSGLGSHLPHIVDANWRQDYVVKSDCIEKVSSSTYLVNLKTDRGKQISFLSSVEELQDLVGKLKDATKSLEHNVHN